MSETAERVKKIVVEHLGVEGDKVTGEASFIDDLGADSLDIVSWSGLRGGVRCRDPGRRRRAITTVKGYAPIISSRTRPEA